MTVCDTNSHNTGWKVMRILRTYDYYDRQESYLYLRCRTQHCIETKIKKVSGHWFDKDFPGMTYKDGVGQ